jgi:hypothetical protein
MIPRGMYPFFVGSQVCGHGTLVLSCFETGSIVRFTCVAFNCTTSCRGLSGYRATDTNESSRSCHDFRCCAIHRDVTMSQCLDWRTHSLMLPGGLCSLAAWLQIESI